MTFYLQLFKYDVENFGNGSKMNYEARNFVLLGEELTRVRLLKLKSKALLNTLQSSFLVLFYYM